MPNLFIVGAAKAGTTSLHNLLAGHPELWMSAWKEPHFFADVNPDRGMEHLLRRLDRDAYLRQYQGAGDARWLGESSPSYLWDPGAAIRIKDASPDARIVTILRDPVDRAYSHYLMDVREGLQKLPFDAAIAADDQVQPRAWGTASHLYVDLGLYAEQLERYLTAFSSDRVLILEYAELRDRPDTVLDRLSTFLGIERVHFSTLGAESSANAYAAPRGRIAAAAMGQARARRLAKTVLPHGVRTFARNRILLQASSKPRVEPGIQRILQARFDADIARLERRLKTSLPSLRETWR